MPQKSRLNLPPIDLGKKTIGERIAHYRKNRGLTQIQLAGEMGLTQSLVSAYELDKLTLSAEMAARFALFFDITTDEIIGLKTNNKPKETHDLKIMKRVREIEELSDYNQKILLRMIDGFIRDAKK